MMKMTTTAIRTIKAKAKITAIERAAVDTFSLLLLSRAAAVVDTFTLLVLSPLLLLVQLMLMSIGR